MNNGDSIAKYAARQERIRQIQDLLANAVVDKTPPDDGVAEPGMVLTARYDDTGDTETFRSACAAPKASKVNADRRLRGNPRVSHISQLRHIECPIECGTPLDPPTRSSPNSASRPNRVPSRLHRRMH